jgi:hypothetical protein
MPFVQRLSAALFGVILVPLTVVAQGGRQHREPVDPNVPTPIEQALMDQFCRTIHAPAGAEADVYQACLTSQFAILRADFGRDLSKLSGTERRRIDLACSRIRNDQGRDAYVACLGDQLAALRARRQGGAGSTAPPPASTTPPAPSPAEGAPPGNAVTTPAAPPAGASASSSSSNVSATALWAGAAGLATAILTAGLLLVRKNRRAARVCRSCGKNFSEPGDLCPTCRHEAAETLRHAAAERVSQERAKQEAERREHEQAEESRRQEEARQAEKARQEKDEEAKAEARREEERQRQEEALQQRGSAAALEPDIVFDPYAILGVGRDAGADAVRAAYQEAKAKYDPANVEFLGSELQDLYRTKGEAVERAFKMLTGEPAA